MTTNVQAENVNTDAPINPVTFTTLEFLIDIWVRELVEVYFNFQNQSTEVMCWDRLYHNEVDQLEKLTDQYNRLNSAVLLIELMEIDVTKILNCLELQVAKIEKFSILINDSTIDRWRFPLYNAFCNSMRNMCCLQLYMAGFVKEWSEYFEELKKMLPLAPLMDFYVDALYHLYNRIWECNALLTETSRLIDKIPFKF